MHLDVEVAGYSSENYDNCDSTKHRPEQERVIVTTGSVFLQMLRDDVIEMATVNLVIFDECHVAMGDHPYVRIMEHYDACPAHLSPRILGLTASVLNDKCKSPVELELNLKDLESSLR